MGVASLSANKRRLESPETGEEEYVVAAKISKKSSDYEETVASVDLNQESIIGHENSSSDFLTTSILARTLLSRSGCGSVSSHASTPLTPTGSFPGSCCANGSSLDYLSSASCCTSSPSPLECLTSTLEALPAPSLLLDVTDEIRCSSFLPFKSTIQETTDLEFNGLLCRERLGNVLSPVDDDEEDDWKRSKGPSNCNQVITEDETGKSYYNLGSGDSLLVAKKSSSSSSGGSSPPSSDTVPNGDPWSSNCNNNADYIDDGGSSSSCESISSEDLFTSEEFDASEDEEEIRSYKQQRSTVLHLSLCKLNSFRSQHCVEPSLHRSVLICNTLRHIEQEIRSEDELPMNRNQSPPPFWGRGAQNRNLANNLPVPPHPPVNQPQITDIRPPSSTPIHAPTPVHSHDPYLSPPYNNGSMGDPPYSCYDYNSMRPNPTPFHTASYDYEQDLPLVSSGTSPAGTTSPTNGVSPGSSPTNSSLMDVSSPNCSLLEGDSGYGEDLNLSSYYYPGDSSRLGGMDSQTDTYLGSCYGPTGLSIPDAGPAAADTLMSDTSSLMSSGNATGVASPLSDISDIEMHSQMQARTGSGGSATCDYLSVGTASEASDSSSASSDTSLSPPPVLTSPELRLGPCTTSNSNLSQLTDGSSSLSWSKISAVPQVSCVTTASNDSHMSSSAPPASNNNKELQTPPNHYSQESHQCGMESRLSEFNRSHINFNSHHNLPMDSLISSAYSNSL